MNRTQDDLKQVIHNMDVFKGFTSDEASRLLKVCKHRAYEPGQHVYTFGEPSREMLILMQGKLEVFSELGIELGTILPGTSTGEMGVFTGQFRSANVISGEKSEGFAIGKQDLNALMESDGEIGLKVFRNMVTLLSERLVSTNSQVESQAHIIQRMQEKIEALSGEGAVEAESIQETAVQQEEETGKPEADRPEEAGEEEAGEEERETRAVQDVTMEGGTVDFEGQNGEISGNVYAGGVVRGQGDVLIRGVVSGQPRSLSVFEIEGNVTAERSVSSAKIQARRIVVQENVEGSSLDSDLDVKVGGDISGSQICLGNRLGEIRILRQFRIEIQRKQQQIKQLEVRINLEARRFVRDYPEMDLSFGNILKPIDRELHVDLDAFYRTLSGRKSSEVDQALEEFILKVIVRHLTRSNQYYISRNPSRQKVFIKFIGDLREHLLAVRKVDRLQEGITDIERRRSVIVEDLKQPPSHRLYVGGEVKEDVAVRMLWFRGLHETEKGTIEMEKQWSEAKPVNTEDGLVLLTTDFHGQTRRIPVESGTLKQGVFRVVKESIVWEQGRVEELRSCFKIRSVGQRASEKVVGKAGE